MIESTSPPRAKFDTALAGLLGRWCVDASPETRAILERLAGSLNLQHSCLSLRQYPTTLVEEISQLDICGDGTTVTPLVLVDDRLYLHRYYEYELKVANDLMRRNKPLETAPMHIDALFKKDDDPFQRLAALQALHRQLLVVTGGPGTGKTSTIVRILALIRQQSPDINIQMAAPTGKAAMRLTESIKGSLNLVPVDVRDAIPTNVRTLHRLLGMRPRDRSFRYRRDNKMLADLLIIDEVSMVDLAMMARVLEALPEHCRLILLGDPGQLPSVDTGNVLADICQEVPGYSEEFARLLSELDGPNVDVSQQSHGLKDAVCRFTHSYRFSAERGIGQMATRILAADPTLPHDDKDVIVQAPDKMLAKLEPLLQPYFNTWHQSHEEMMAAFDQLRILCPIRDGDLGVHQINFAIEELLVSKGLRAPGDHFYHGRPVIVLRNDYQLGLFNGDVGLCVEVDDDIQVAFPGVDGELQYYLASRLPEHKTCFAMTVHKSQGSEFNHVVMSLPPPATEQAAALYTRELVYTGVTRAKQKLSLFTDDSTWSAAIGRTSERASGLGALFI